LSYTESGEKLKVISKRRGLSSFLADRLAYSALWFSHLFVAFLTSAIVYAAERVRYDGKDGWPMVAGILGFLASYMIASAFLVCVESAVRTVIICFAEFPERFRAGHPEEFNKLEHGWSKAYPTAWWVSNHLCTFKWSDGRTVETIGAPLIIQHRSSRLYSTPIVSTNKMKLIVSPTASHVSEGMEEEKTSS
jgi:hypothetical protein